MERAVLAEACASVGLFPLPTLALMPGMLLPLHVFEPRYRDLVRDCLSREAPLCVPQLRTPAGMDALGRPRIHDYACVGKIVANHELADGRYNVLVQPLGRVRIMDEPLSDKSFRVARAALLHDTPVDTMNLSKVGSSLRVVLAPLLGRIPEAARGLSRALEELPDEAVPTAIASMVLQDPEARQRYLAQDDPRMRAEQVLQAALTFLAESQVSATTAEA